MNKHQSFKGILIMDHYLICCKLTFDLHGNKKLYILNTNYYKFIFQRKSWNQNFNVRMHKVFFPPPRKRNRYLPSGCKPWLLFSSTMFSNRFKLDFSESFVENLEIKGLWIWNLGSKPDKRLHDLIKN